MRDKFDCDKFLTFLYEKNESIKLQRKFNVFLQLKKILDFPVRPKKEYTGVYKINDRFRCSIYLNSKKKHIGYFDTEMEAVIAYNQYIIDHQLNNKLNQIK